MQQETPKQSNTVGHSQPYFLRLSAVLDPTTELKLEKADNPLPHGTLGDIGLATSVVGPSEFPLTILIQPFDRTALTGIEATSVRVFRWDSTIGSLKPIWNSGINIALGFVWTKISRPGIYVPIGLPLDTLLQATLRSMAHQRRYADPDSTESMKAITNSTLAVFNKVPQEDLEESRRLLTIVEAQTHLKLSANRDIRHGRGGYIQSFPLPQNASLEDFTKRLARLETPPGGLPEEALFFKPELLQELMSHEMSDPENSVSTPEIDQRALDKLPIRDRIAPLHHHLSPYMYFSRNWWMYHHDARHTGHASGHSGIRSTSVGELQLRSSISLDGSVVTIPSIVHGKIYVGTSDINFPGGGGTLYKIGLASGSVERTFSTTGRTPAYAQGIGGSPAIADGKVYFSIIPGKVYCVDAHTFTLLWVTDLRNADPTHNQPVQNDNADCWSSPLVVNGKVYVGCGEGEFDAFGFVYCLDAGTGNVIWLFCTNKLSSTADNNPNVIPNSATGAAPLLTGFTQQADPPVKGVSIWSSCAYDSVLNRIYVGTGNSTAGDENPLPDAYYGSGVLALDADTGEFKGFFQPDPSDSYKLTDLDVDVPASPLLFMDEDEDTEVLAIGSKNGSFFLLDADTMTPLKRRQLLPYDAAGNPLPNVDTDPLHENMFGVFGTAALHHGLGRLFVGIGGYDGAIDSPTTPFMRALDWRTLEDAWITTTGADGVARYIVPSPPMYTTPQEVGLSSPAVVNDVVLVSTTKPGLYAFDAATGLCLWSAGGLAPGYPMGPAIYGGYVVIGSGNALNIYSL
jgi:outer membrane protein assembly factor BamB